MTTDDIITRTKEISKANNVTHLYLFGSYAAGDAMQQSDLDFFVKGVEDISKLREEIDAIPTLHKIDIIDYDRCQNKYLIEDMDKYGTQIY